MAFLPCILCSDKLEKRTSKRAKPYFVCERCGIQLFVRRKEGIEKLEEFFRNAEKAQISYTRHAQSFHEMQAVLQEISDVQLEINKIGLSHVFSLEQSRIRDAFLKRKENLLLHLEQLSERKSTPDEKHSTELS
jgi:DNA-directed RNA polymerase subunit RPC12/RpoP